MTPTPNAPLKAEDVALLREGDLLRSITDEYYWRKNGAACVVLNPPALPGSPGHIHYRAIRPDGSEGLGSTGDPETFTFVSRPPSVSADPVGGVTSGAGEVELAASICAILEDEGGSGSPWSVVAERIAASIIDENHLAVSSWVQRAALEKIAGEQQYRSGYCQTDITVEPALSAEEAQSLARETLAALTPSPPVQLSEREREAVAFMEGAAAMLQRGEMPAAGVPYSMRWATAHRTILAALTRTTGEGS